MQFERGHARLGKVRIKKTSSGGHRGRWLMLVRLFFNLSLLAFAVEPSSATTYQYDASGRLQSASDSAGNTADYVYDSRGNLIRIVRRDSALLAVTSFSPAFGEPGVQVTINGSGFGSTTASNTVSFNGTSAAVLSASSTQLVVQVPIGATSGTIAVTTAGATGTSSDSFTVTQTGLPPVITSVSPSVAAYGATITLSGQNFYPLPGQTSIFVGGVNVYPSSITDLQITFVLPAFVNSGTISVSTPYGSATGSATLYVTPTGISASNIATYAPLAIDATAANVSLSSSQYAEFTFQGNQNDYLSLQGSAFSTSSNVSYSITSPLGVAVASGNISSASPTAHLPRLVGAGTYTVLIGSGSSATTLSIQIEKNPTLSLGNGSVSLSSSAVKQTKRFIFYATAGQDPGVSISGLALNPSSVTSASISVLKPDGTTLVSSSTCTVSTTGCGRNLGILPMSGAYQVLLTPSSSATMSFSAAMVMPTTEAISANGAATAETFSIPGRSAHLNFDGAVGQRISMQTSSVSLSSTFYDLIVLNPDGTIFYSTTNNYGSTYYGVWTLTQTGTYTVLLSPTSGGTGSMTVKVYTVPADIAMAATADGTANAISIGTPGQIARLTFSGTAGQRISMVSSGVSLSGSAFKLTILSPSGATFYSASNNYGTTYYGVLTLTETGTYTAVIEPNNGGTGTVTLKVYVLPPDVAAAATADGSANALSFSTPGQIARVTFSGTTGQRVSMVSSGVSLSGLAFKLTILSPDGTTLYSASNNYGTTYYGLFTLAQTGTYTVVIEPNTGGTGSVTLKIYTVASDISATIAADGTANAISIGLPGQIANLSFSGTVGQRISMQTSGLSLSGTYYSLTILNPDGTTFYSTTNNYGSSNFYGVFTLTQTGTYTIVLRPNSGGTGSATLKVYTVPADTTASIAVNGASAVAALGTPGQVANLTFSGTSGHTVTLSLSASTFSQYYYVAILNPDGTNLLAKSQTSGSKTYGAYTLTQTGTYTIVVSPYNGGVGSITAALTGT